MAVSLFFEMKQGRLSKKHYEQLGWRCDGKEWRLEKFKVQNINSAIITNGLRPTIPASCPEDIKKLIKKCWDAVPSNRPTTSTIIEHCPLRNCSSSIKDLEHASDQKWDASYC